MAQSRLEKIGTIFTRVSGLLKGGAMKVEDKPIWYDVYAAFPPKLEPRYDRPAPDIPIRNIFYEEDVVRAKYHKSLKQTETINLGDTKRETQSQQFIKIYNDLRSQGALDAEQIFATAEELLKERRSQTSHQAQQTAVDVDMEATPSDTDKPSLLQSFVEAKQSAESEPASDVSSNKKMPQKAGINIENLFKD